MFSIIASAIDLLAVLIKSIFKQKKHKNDQKSIKELSAEPVRTGSETPLRPEESQRNSQGPRKRRKSITETVTRTFIIETEGSSSPDSAEKAVV